MLPRRLRNYVDNQNWTAIIIEAKGAIQNTLPDTCDLNMDATVTGMAKDALMIAPELETQLTRRLADLDLKITILERNRERSTELADYLERTRP